MLTYKLTSKVNSPSTDWYYTLSIKDAKKIVSHLKIYSKNPFEYIGLTQHIRSAVKKKQTQITIRTFRCIRFFHLLCDVAGFENVIEGDRVDFINWRNTNFYYSGLVEEGLEHETYWFSKSASDFNIYSETELRKEYQDLGKAVENPTKA